jgi:hypothetical protein
MYVNKGGQRVGLLRVYNNGKKTAKVKTEHDILLQLGQQTLTFAVPRARLSKDGQPYVVLSSGDASCVFEIINGSLAKTTSPEEVGRATGELCTAMSKVHLDHTPPIPPYYDVFNVHHALGGDKERFYADAASNPAHAVCREAMDYLCEQIKALEPKLEAYQQLGLPMQMIHGDLHYVSNSVPQLLQVLLVAAEWLTVLLQLTRLCPEGWCDAQLHAGCCIHPPPTCLAKLLSARLLLCPVMAHCAHRFQGCGTRCPAAPLAHRHVDTCCLCHYCLSWPNRTM